MKLIILAFLLISFSLSAQVINPANWPGLVGYWNFDDSNDLIHAGVGNDLVLGGTDQAVAGPDANDGASRIGIGDYYTCTHGISPNGGGSYVNEYTLVVDFKIPQVGQYYCFYQTNMANSNDGELFINPTGKVGISGIGYSYCTLAPNEWYRLVIAVDLGSSFEYYIDGELIHTGVSQSIDGRYSLDPYFHWFRDDNSEDNEFDIAAAGIFDYTLTSTEINQLGGYGHTFPSPPLAGLNPYLQNPTPNSIYVSWHSDELSSTIAEYGTTNQLGQQTTGSYEDISGKKWHTVQLQGLSANTDYFYRCISGNDTSDINTFRTAHMPGTANEHIRFVLIGDSRTDTYQSHYISGQIEQQLISDYGFDWYKQVDFVMHVGDIVTSGSQIGQYQNEYFTPYANLSKNVPFMTSIGNHENENPIYYKYMKYESLTGSPYELPSAYNEKFYKFRLGDCQFIAINSNYQYALAQQTTWFENALTEADADTGIDFVFTYCHHPGHSELWPDGNTSYVQNDIIPTLKQHAKPVMLAYGHSHDYERGEVELDNANSGVKNDMSIVLSGGAGSGLDRWGMYGNQEDYPEVNFTLDHYVYSIIDVDIDNLSLTARTFSFGHTDKQLQNELVDSWYYKKNQAAPDKPVAFDVSGTGTSTITLIASAFSGNDSIFSSEFQLSDIPGDYSSPRIDSVRNKINNYGDTGAPDYLSVNLNEGIVLEAMDISNIYSPTQQYSWRVRYCDHNMKWSEWSDDYFIYPVSVDELKDKGNTLSVNPNPFSSSPEITFTLKKNSTVSLEVFDIDNKLVGVVISEKRLRKGKHKYTWDIDSKSTISSGQYFCRLTSGDKVINAKMVFIK